MVDIPRHHLSWRYYFKEHNEAQAGLRSKTNLMGVSHFGPLIINLQAAVHYFFALSQQRPCPALLLLLSSPPPLSWPGSGPSHLFTVFTQCSPEQEQRQSQQCVQVFWFVLPSIANCDIQWQRWSFTHSYDIIMMGWRGTCNQPVNAIWSTGD